MTPIETQGASERVDVSGLAVGVPLYDFIENEALPNSGVDRDEFWNGLASLFADFGPANAELLEFRNELQAAIDSWHRQHRNQPHDPQAYRAFLEDIGYLVSEGPSFTIDTANVDHELSTTPGPQLVVPVMNSRFAINAANARWGSLYDALYGTDALGDLPEPGPFDPARGERVFAWAKRFLDRSVPLATGSHSEVEAYVVVDGVLTPPLADPSQFVGYVGDPTEVSAVLLRNNGMHIEIQIDPTHSIGAVDQAGVKDVVIEAAVTAIMDCEDSVAAVDAQDKALAYRNWLGLNKGDLIAEVTKGDATFSRALDPNRNYVGPGGEPVTLAGRATMLVRNVGQLMTTPAVLDSAGQEVSEGLLDAMVTVLCAKHDLNRPLASRSSRAGSVYVVKPKMHGPDEASLVNAVFDRVEQVLGLKPNTVKLGVMDEERRTTLNLKECIRAVSSRVVFINTGFLDRTGDEIHTSIEAGPVVPKTHMKSQTWIRAYEDWNVDVGLSCGLSGRAQIGKGMWATPDLMAEMLDQKIDHPRSGANCAWVPSPTAATLHATHYHQVDVLERQRELAAGGPRASIDQLLTIPIAEPGDWAQEAIQAEIENNAQGILGYVVRWVDQGIGCSKVPNIDNIALMEDRATCRISSQHMANWLHHGIVDADQVRATMRKMAAVVDRQNEDDPNYVAMGPSFDGPAFRAACDLVLSGREQPSGYTEPILHARRRESKAIAQ